MTEQEQERAIKKLEDAEKHGIGSPQKYKDKVLCFRTGYRLSFKLSTMQEVDDLIKRAKGGWK